MESLPSKDQLYGFWKAGVAKAKQYAYNLSPMELLVENATSNDAWGPTGTEMSGELGRVAVAGSGSGQSVLLCALAALQLQGVSHPPSPCVLVPQQP